MGEPIPETMAEDSQQNVQSPAAIVLSDGGVGGLVAAAIVAEEHLRSEQRDGPGPVVVPCPIEHRDPQVALDAVGAQAELLGLRVDRRAMAAFDLAAGADHSAGIVLTNAVEWARAVGAHRVVWPAVAESDSNGEPMVESIAAILDTALLVTRLSASVTGGADEIEVSAPLADLSVRQVLDLVEDFGLPLDVVWWNRHGVHRDVAEAMRKRWGRVTAVKSASGTLPRHDRPPPADHPVSDSLVQDRVAVDAG